MRFRGYARKIRAMPRPRIHEPGSTASDRKNASLAALYTRGGKVKSVAFEAEDLAAIDTIRRRYGLSTDRDAIAFALRMASATALLPASHTEESRKKAA